MLFKILIFQLIIKLATAFYVDVRGVYFVYKYSIKFKKSQTVTIRIITKKVIKLSLY